MLLVNEELSVWEIGFRWANRDPDRRWWRLPLPVRDNFRVLMDAILNTHLLCLTLSLEKHDPTSGDPPEMFIRHHLDAVQACIQGVKYERSLLRWARIERWEFQKWCERRAIPLPEFWFPSWSEYRYPEDEEEPLSATPASAIAPARAEEASDAVGLRPVQRVKIACQQIAASVWKAEPTLPIKEMAEREEVQRFGGGAYYDVEVVKRWVSEVDPRDPKTKRGRRVDFCRKLPHIYVPRWTRLTTCRFHTFNPLRPITTGQRSVKTQVGYKRKPTVCCE